MYQRFAQFGEIKSVYPSDKRPDVKFIEFYDSRVSFSLPFPLILLATATDRSLIRVGGDVMADRPALKLTTR